MEELQKQIASLVEQEANKRAASVLEKLATYISELQKELATHPPVEPVAKEKTAPAAAVADTTAHDAASGIVELRGPRRRGAEAGRGFPPARLLDERGVTLR